MVEPKRKSKTSRETDWVRRDGGFCPAFVNTASAKRTPIETYGDLLAWGRRCDALGEADARRLERAAGQHPEAAAEVVAKAKELRRGMERILLALVDGEAPPADDLEALNAVIGQVLGQRRLVPAADGYHQWGWDDRDGDDLDRMLWPVVLSAAEILVSRLRRRVGRCAGEGCDLLFVHRAGGSPRKWCDMKDCGRSVRDRKHYQRKKRKFHAVRAAREKERRPSGLEPETDS